MIVVGQFPTAGVEAETARGSFNLPEGFSVTVPTGRFTLPDGSIFLEGQGVPPTLDVPVDATTALSAEDVVLQAGIDVVLQPLGAGVTPSAAPKVADAANAEAAFTFGRRLSRRPCPRKLRSRRPLPSPVPRPIPSRWTSLSL